VEFFVRSFILNETSVKGTLYLLTYLSYVLMFFSGLLNKAQTEKGLHGIQIARGTLKINHLFFADDSLIFCRDFFQDAQPIQEILNAYQSASDQLINLDKSEIFFSRNVPDDRKILLQGWM